MAPDLAFGRAFGFRRSLIFSGHLGLFPGYYRLSVLSCGAVFADLLIDLSLKILPRFLCFCVVLADAYNTTRPLLCVLCASTLDLVCALIRDWLGEDIHERLFGVAGLEVKADCL